MISSPKANTTLVKKQSLVPNNNNSQSLTQNKLIHEKNIFLVSCDAHRLCDSNGAERKHLR